MKARRSGFEGQIWGLSFAPGRFIRISDGNNGPLCKEKQNWLSEVKLVWETKNSIM